MDMRHAPFTYGTRRHTSSSAVGALTRGRDTGRRILPGGLLPPPSPWYLRTVVTGAGVTVTRPARATNCVWQEACRRSAAGRAAWSGGLTFDLVAQRPEP